MMLLTGGLKHFLWLPSSLATKQLGSPSQFIDGGDISALEKYPATTQPDIPWINIINDLIFNVLEYIVCKDHPSDCVEKITLSFLRAISLGRKLRSVSNKSSFRMALKIKN